ncbi:MAG: Actin cross-linking toxin VgrG1 [Luteibacter sp.]|uniref:type VI secretion system Vgr family protein n=1 Tax=Luteibacter sp. TaxID=1886636 RepID=UPI00137ECE64|nr:type VI secretion system tip protein TssI/VgrG [Luteibacter sp.]KAF1009023.1 MAG: Actin cross-linking toxin VgrG1 [Luteibacter sp.]
MAHAIQLTSSLGETLLFSNMTAAEQLGRLFAYDVEAISRDVSIDLRALLGTPMTVTLTTPQGYVRYFNGIVAEAEQTGFVMVDNVRYAVYKVHLVPKPWLLKQTLDCRIYKNQTVPDIVRALLAEFGYGDVKLSLSGSYTAREYCVQYRESYFDFISRLMEQEGIYYYFTHTRSTHTMVLSDSLGAHKTVSTFEQIPYAPPTERGHRVKASISEWSLANTVNPTRVRLDDYDYLRPKASLAANEEVTDHAHAHGISNLDIYDYPYQTQGYEQQVKDGNRYAQVRVDALSVRQATSSGVTDAAGMATGILFTLKDFPLGAANREYLVIETTIRLVEVDYQTGGGAPDMDESPFACEFKVIASQQPFRTLATTPHPRIAGLQTAVVYGTTPEDIAVDKYGRVQVTFFWNPPGKPKADQSCPVRVASGWAGKRWGAVQIPRVGQEVVVSFLEGNPDRPLIVGSVYNADNMPPYDLPSEKTRSGVKSRSHPGGGPADYNEIRFEDKAGSEELLLHAQQDMREEAERDHDVDTGRNYRLVAGQQIELVTGASRLVMKSTGEIEISGLSLQLKGSVSVDVEAGANCKINAMGAMEVMANTLLTIKGMPVLINGTPVLINGMPPMPMPV